VKCETDTNGNNEDVLVSNTCMTLRSFSLDGGNDSPPRTNTLAPTEAMACPERPLGDGPIFWNMYQRWSARVDYSLVIWPMIVEVN
jgi:hypothetical protein